MHHLLLVRSTLTCIRSGSDIEDISGGHVRSCERSALVLTAVVVHSVRKQTRFQS